MKALAVALLLAFTATADERIIAAAANTPGANGTFWRTELRLLNVATTPITIEARIVGGETRSIELAPGATVRYSDVLPELFATTGVAAIALRSDAPFEATSRTFTTGACGSYGQFIPAATRDSAVTRGVLMHLRSDASFRTNIGFVNDSDQTATVTLWPLHAAPRALTVAPRSSTQLGYDGNDLLRFDSSVPLIAYASVVDNASGDAIFVPAVADRGDGARTFDVEAQQFRYIVTPGGAETIHVKRGDRVVLRLRSKDTIHGFFMPGVLPHQTLVAGDPIKEVSFVATEPGTFEFFCTIECGSGHHGMRGQLIVEP